MALQLQCNICHVNYEKAVLYLLKKLTPSAPFELRSFLESIAKCSEDITHAIINTVAEKDIQYAIIYIINTYHYQLSHAIEKAFFKKGFTIKINSITVSLEQYTPEYCIQINFQVISSSIKILNPFLSDNLFGRLLHIKPLTDALSALAETTFQTQFDFAEMKNLSITSIP